MADLTVVTNSGPVRGVKKVSVFGTTYISFQKIPFAKPPVGELRFKDPRPAEPWTEVLDASQEGPACYHFSTTYNRLIGDEDCLYINVFTKTLHPPAPTPVMVYIYGGAFSKGSSTTDMYGPDFLLEKNVILVTFNYRLGPLGFLSLDDPSLGIPGNAGLKDQALAMQWVKTNIDRFGGDVNNITLFGNSAGAASVHYHMVSERSKGLFDRAIIMSGCILSHWALSPRHNFGERLAAKLGWNGKDGENGALQFLRTAPLDQMVVVQDDLLTPEERRDRISIPFGPTVEPYVSENCLFDRSPLEMCRNAWSAGMDVIIGGTSDEGLMSYRGLMDNPSKLKSVGDFEYLVPKELGLARDSEKCKKLGLELKQIYYPDLSEPSVDNIDGFIQFLTDEIFWHGIHRTVLSRINARNAGATYLYRFSVDSPTFNHYRIMNCGPGVRGTSHADDLSYVFKNRIGGKPPEGSLEFKTMERMVSVFTSFAITGNPNCEILGNVKWEPVQGTEAPFKCLNVDEKVKFVNHPRARRLAYWDSMFEPGKLY